MIATRADAVPQLAEVFRSHGFAGASLSEISQATGLGKGSLYNFFPGGKDEMAKTVLADIESWFQAKIFAPLKSALPLDERLTLMFSDIIDYFASGHRICLVGAFALGAERDKFVDQITGYFVDWTEALRQALEEGGHSEHPQELAEEVVSGIQGALILGRALNDPSRFVAILHRLEDRLLKECRP
ncbi:TetR/AcrR family transcriptional regulator [Pseudarthrobacter sp. H2]|uniref:TetR/AcrR family transcriptional regulator n=1 Tax=Pseudarthrobacter sp. H2 TaxID=3418415 RepID=UPI003CED5E98